MKQTTYEGLVIAGTVILLLAGGVVAWYVLKWLVRFLLPGFF